MEKTSLFVVFALVICMQSMLTAGLDVEQKKECLKLTKRTLKGMMKAFKACNDKLQLHHISGEEYQKKIGCVVKCVMKTVNVLDDNDMMTEATLKMTIESHVPPEFVGPAHTALMQCVTDNKLDPKDENCKSYLDMGTCMQSTMVELCGEPPLM